MKQKTEELHHVRIPELSQKIKHTLEKIWKEVFEWSVVLGILAGFGWLQLQVQHSMRSAAGSIVLILIVLVEVFLLVLVNRLFI